jgi:hypothetical protein
MRAGSAIAKFCFVHWYDVEGFGVDDTGDKILFRCFGCLKPRIRSATGFDSKETDDDSGETVEEFNSVFVDN